MSFLDFVPISKLGEGSFGTVYKVRRLTDQKIYAMKKVNIARLDTKAKNSALNQVRILASLDSKFIVRYCQAFFQQKLDMLCIVMEYAESGDLSFLIKDAIKRKSNVKQIEIWSVMIQVLKGLKYMHGKGILHRDLKTENIFIFNAQSGSQVMGRTVKIGDLNVSKVTKNHQNIAMTQTGTPYYASPQIWDDKPYDQKSDIWALGCILYELATLHVPFQAKNMSQLYQKIKSGRIKDIPCFYSKQLNQIIKNCLKVSSDQRASVSQLLENFTVRMYGNLLGCSQQIQQRQMNKEAQFNNKQFLRTIYMPENKKLLKNQLPKANYQHQIKSYQEQKNKDTKSMVSNNLKEGKFSQVDQRSQVNSCVQCISTEPDQKKDCNKNRQQKSLYNENIDKFVSPKANKRRSIPKTQKPIRKHESQYKVQQLCLKSSKNPRQPQQNIRHDFFTRNYESPLNRYIIQSQKHIYNRVSDEKTKIRKKDQFDKIYSQKIQNLLNKKLIVLKQQKEQILKIQINQQNITHKQMFNQCLISKQSNQKQNTPIRKIQKDITQYNSRSQKNQFLKQKVGSMIDKKKPQRDIPKSVSSLQLVFQKLDLGALKRARQNILLNC